MNEPKLLQKIQELIANVRNEFAQNKANDETEVVWNKTDGVDAVWNAFRKNWKSVIEACNAPIELTKKQNEELEVEAKGVVKQCQKEEALFALCQNFITDHKISGPETISQMDDVIISAYDFIEDVCKIVGYYKYEDENE